MCSVCGESKGIFNLDGKRVCYFCYDADWSQK